ncbi:hypothetical protein M0R19_00910 [Candidatus Pacearchaeota archaeon]|jgi:hypothetical protein|nr:hypothetical protein [Candidatus Pacearchaeota archaeon]
MTRSKKAKLENSLTRITSFEFNKDRYGNYILYCNYYCHRGVVGSIKAEECINKGCKHYIIFREEND